MNAYPHAAVGRLQSASPIVHSREFIKLQDERQQSWDSALRWSRVSEAVKPATIVVAPTAILLVATAVVAPVFSPLVVGAAAVAGGVALLVSAVSKLKQKLATSRANELTQRIAHVRGSQKKVDPQIDGNGPAILGRLRDRREAPQPFGRKGEPQNKSRQPKNR